MCTAAEKEKVPFWHLKERSKKYDQQFKIVFEAIKQLLEPLEKPKGQIGFHVED